MRILQVEWLKLRHYRVFWVLLGLYFLGMVLPLSSGMFLLEFLKNQGVEYNGISPAMLPIYDFRDIWHNLTYLANFLKVLPAFIVVISVANEISYTTMRQNIIDSLTKTEFLLSKISFIIAMALFSTVVLFLNGLVLGLIYSPVKDAGSIFMHIEFLFAHFLQLVVYFHFVFIITLILRKTGLVVFLLLGYTIIFEPIVAAILLNAPFIPDTIRWIADMLPNRSINNLIKVPFGKYVFMETQTGITSKALLILLGWMIVYLGSIFGWIHNRDLS